MSDYTEDHARSGIDTELPPIEVWPNQFGGYEITIEMPESPRFAQRPNCPTLAR
jgi:7-cyano-7-deazaguanine reductase